MNLKKASKKEIALMCFLLLIGLTGCSTTNYLIDKQDIQSIRKGDTYTADRDGWFVSDYALKNVLKVKLEEK